MSLQVVCAHNVLNACVEFGLYYFGIFVRVRLVSVSRLSLLNMSKCDGLDADRPLNILQKENLF